MDLEFQQTEPGEKLYLDRKNQTCKVHRAEKPQGSEGISGRAIVIHPVVIPSDQSESRDLRTDSTFAVSIVRRSFDSACTSLRMTAACIIMESV